MLYSILRNIGISKIRNPRPMRAMGMRMAIREGKAGIRRFFIWDDFTRQGEFTQTSLFFCSLFGGLGWCSIDNRMENHSPETDPQPFTDKELEVIQSLLQGKSTQQIALQPGVSTRPVEHHLTHIYEKLEVCSRTEAVIKLVHLFEK